MRGKEHVPPPLIRQLLRPLLSRSRPCRMALNSSPSHPTKSSPSLIPSLLTAVRVMHHVSGLIRNVEQLPGAKDQGDDVADLKSRVQVEAR